MSDSSEPLDGVEILLVEDNPTDAQLTLEALEKANVRAQVKVVSDGAEALAFLFCTGRYAHQDIEKGPDLVLLDLTLPKVNGITVLQQLRLNPQTKDVPVIVISSSLDNPDLRTCHTLGVKGHLVKPVDVEQINEVV